MLAAYASGLLATAMLTWSQSSLLALGRLPEPILCSLGASLKYRLETSVDLDLMAWYVKIKDSAGIDTYQRFLGIADTNSAEDSRAVLEAKCLRFNVHPTVLPVSQTHGSYSVGELRFDLRPHPDCLRMCEPFVVAGALHSQFAHGPVLLSLLPKLDAWGALIGAVWACVAGFRVLRAPHQPGICDELALARSVRRGLIFSVVAQMVVGTSHAMIIAMGLARWIAHGPHHGTIGEVLQASLTLTICSILFVVCFHALSTILLAACALKVYLCYHMLFFCRVCIIILLETLRWCWTCGVAAFRFCFTDSELNGSLELSRPSSRSFVFSGRSLGEDDTCALCLDSLASLCLASESPPRPSLRTALCKLRPRFRMAATQTQREVRLVRLRQCGHAFHAQCFAHLTSAAASLARDRCVACPTCGRPSHRRVWRRAWPGLRPFVGDLAQVLAHELSQPMVLSFFLCVLGVGVIHALTYVIEWLGVSMATVDLVLVDFTCISRLLMTALDELPLSDGQKAALSLLASTAFGYMFRERPWPLVVCSRIACYCVWFGVW